MASKKSPLKKKNLVKIEYISKKHKPNLKPQKPKKIKKKIKKIKKHKKIKKIVKKKHGFGFFDIFAAKPKPKTEPKPHKMTRAQIKARAQKKRQAKQEAARKRKQAHQARIRAITQAKTRKIAERKNKRLAKKRAIEQAKLAKQRTIAARKAAALKEIAAKKARILKAKADKQARIRAIAQAKIKAKADRIVKIKAAKQAAIKAKAQRIANLKSARLAKIKAVKQAKVDKTRKRKQAHQARLRTIAQAKVDKARKRKQAHQARLNKIKQEKIQRIKAKRREKLLRLREKKRQSDLLKKQKQQEKKQKIEDAKKKAERREHGFFAFLLGESAKKKVVKKSKKSKKNVKKLKKAKKIKKPGKIKRLRRLQELRKAREARKARRLRKLRELRKAREAAKARKLRKLRELRKAREARKAAKVRRLKLKRAKRSKKVKKPTKLQAKTKVKVKKQKSKGFFSILFGAKPRHRRKPEPESKLITKPVAEPKESKLKQPQIKLKKQKFLKSAALAQAIVKESTEPKAVEQKPKKLTLKQRMALRKKQRLKAKQEKLRLKKEEKNRKLRLKKQRAKIKALEKQEKQKQKEEVAEPPEVFKQDGDSSESLAQDGGFVETGPGEKRLKEEVLTEKEVLTPKKGELKQVQKAVMTPTHLDKKGKVTYLKTGISGFDQLLREGIPEGTSILVEGGPGSGKTIFCLELVKTMCAQGKKVLYMSFEEPEYRLRNHLKNFGVDASKLEKAKKLYIKRFNALDIARSVEALLSEAKKELLIDVQPVLIPHDFEPDIVLIDSLTSIGSAFSGEESRFRIYMEQLFRYLESHQITSFLIRETNNPTHIGTSFVEKAEAVSFLSDGIIALYNVFLPDGQRKRALEIVKMRGVHIERKIVEVDIVGGKGLFVYPNRVLKGHYKLT